MMNTIIKELKLDESNDDQYDYLFIFLLFILDWQKITDF